MPAITTSCRDPLGARHTLGPKKAAPPVTATTVTRGGANLTRERTVSDEEEPTPRQLDLQVHPRKKLGFLPIPEEILTTIVSAKLSAAAMRVAMVLLRAAASRIQLSIADIGKAAGILERAARGAVSRLLVEGGVLFGWVRRDDHGRAPRWSLTGMDAPIIWSVPMPVSMPLVEQRPLFAGLPGTTHAGLPGTDADQQASVSGVLQGITEDLGEPSSLLGEGEDLDSRVETLTETLTRLGEDIAAQRSVEEHRNLHPAGADRWRQVLLDLTKVTRSLGTAYAYLRAGLTIERNGNFVGWKRILAVAPEVAKKLTFQRAVRTGWGVAPGWTLREQLRATSPGRSVVPPTKVADGGLWERAVSTLQATLGPVAETWLPNVRLASITPTVAVIEVPSALHHEGVLMNLGAALHNALGLRLEFIINPNMVAG